MQTPPWLKIVKYHFRPTLIEFVYFFIFALMPIWLGSVVNLLLKKNVIEHLSNYFYSGEALLICTASIGPMMFLIHREYSKNNEGFSKSFPGKNLFIPVIIIICLLSATILVTKTTVKIEMLSLNVIWYSSLLATIISTIIWFSVNIFRSIIEIGAPGIMRQDTQDFVAQWRGNNAE